MGPTLCDVYGPNYRQKSNSTENHRQPISSNHRHFPKQHCHFRIIASYRGITLKWSEEANGCVSYYSTCIIYTHRIVTFIAEQLLTDKTNHTANAKKSNLLIQSRAQSNTLISLCQLIGQNVVILFVDGRLITLEGTCQQHTSYKTLVLRSYLPKLKPN